LYIRRGKKIPVPLQQSYHKTLSVGTIVSVLQGVAKTATQVEMFKLEHLVAENIERFIPSE
jgi:hypothetical protein